VSACQFTYQPGATERQGLLTLYLELMEAGEKVGLYHEVHVDNAP
jgi:MSHA biogenesis protein MshO